MSNLSFNKNRIQYIDIARGMGIILVYIGHVLPPGNLIRSFIFLFHMPLFFFISGYLIDEHKQGFIRFSMHKIKSIISPCVIYGSMAVAVEMLTNADYNLSALTVSLPHVFWFLPVLFFCELLLFIFWKIFKTNISRWGVVALLLIIGMVLFPLKWPYDLSLVPLCTSYCALGNLSKTSNLVEKYSNNILYPIVLLLPLVLYVLYSNQTNNFDHHIITNGYIGYILSLFGIFSILLLSKVFEGKDCKAKDLVRYCGLNSLIIYALHMTLLKLLVYAFLPIKEFFGPIEFHLCFIVENIINIVIIWLFIECKNRIYARIKH